MLEVLDTRVIKYSCRCGILKSKTECLKTAENDGVFSPDHRPSVDFSKKAEYFYLEDLTVYRLTNTSTTKIFTIPKTDDDNDYYFFKIKNKYLIADFGFTYRIYQFDVPTDWDGSTEKGPTPKMEFCYASDNIVNDPRISASDDYIYLTCLDINDQNQYWVDRIDPVHQKITTIIVESAYQDIYKIEGQLYGLTFNYQVHQLLEFYHLGYLPQAYKTQILLAVKFLKQYLVLDLVKLIISYLLEDLSRFGCDRFKLRELSSDIETMKIYWRSK